MSSLSDKQRVLSNGVVYLVQQWRKYNYRAYGVYKASEQKDATELSELARLYNDYYDFYKDDWLIAEQVIHNKYRRTKRVRQKIKSVVLSNDGQFITLTFTDDVIATTTEKTRRAYVIRYLKSVSPSFYLANIDYGSKNGREHYHAIVKGRIDYKPWRKYGSINAKVIRASDKDTQKISKYITKLTNHAIKNTTKQPKLIYSRKNSII
jgi:hypothetical protein